MNITKTLVALIGSQICSGSLDEKIAEEISASDLKKLYEVSRAHDVAHLVGAAISKYCGDFSDKESVSLFSNEYMLAVFRYRRFADELVQITELFEEEGVENIPLKGSVLRDCYPEPWMRTSCDIDILVKKEELDRAKMLLETRLGYEFFARSRHDISLNSPTGVHLELHHTLIEEDGAGYEEKVLNNVWENTALYDGKKFTRVMADSVFYFYHIAHMLKHFLSGGCGIKSIVDLWILDNKVVHDDELRQRTLCEGGFFRFADGMKRLSAVWFDGADRDDFTDSLENFIVSGGVYGTVQNSASIGVVKKQGRLKYALSRIFPPFDSMKKMYPSLQKHKWLLPFCHIRRWFRVVFKGGMKKAVAEIGKSKDISSAEIGKTEILLAELGLVKNSS